MSDTEAAPQSAALPPGIDQAFAAVVGELGMATASWLFVRAVSRCNGDAGVAALADQVGSSFTVLDAIAREWLDGKREMQVDVEPVLAAIGKATRIVIVGLDAAFVDALVERVAGRAQIALVAHSMFEVNWERVFDNWGGKVERVDLDSFQRWAGGKSALVTFAYGRQGSRTAVDPLWHRACGVDVRPQFRSLVAWDVLGVPLGLHPRWLVEGDADSFTHFVR
jgi:hypothetical protein